MEQNIFFLHLLSIYFQCILNSASPHFFSATICDIFVCSASIRFQWILNILSVNINNCVCHLSFVNIKLVFLWIFTLCLSFECHLELFMLWLRLGPTFQMFDLSNAESFCFIFQKAAKFCRNYLQSKVVVTANACNCTVYIMSQKFDQIWKYVTATKHNVKPRKILWGYNWVQRMERNGAKHCSGYHWYCMIIIYWGAHW